MRKPQGQIPSQQGLKLQFWERIHFGPRPQGQIPSQQGLKLFGVAILRRHNAPQGQIPSQQGLKRQIRDRDEKLTAASRPNSITTRIETRIFWLGLGLFKPPQGQIPSQQGLKRASEDWRRAPKQPQGQIPSQQGLKLTTADNMSWNHDFLKAKFHHNKD